MFNIQYQQWAGSGQSRVWKQWKGPFDSKATAERELAKQQEIWPNDNFRINHNCGYSTSNLVGSYGGGIAVYECRDCGEEWEKDVS